MDTQRVLVVTSDVAFVEGGHLSIARGTVRALRELGHEADLMLTPQNRFGRQLRAYWATRLTDVGLDGLGRPIDRVISLRFPSYAVKHPAHVCWLNHRMREYYDLWDDLKARLSWKGRIKEGARRFLIHRIDGRLLKKNVRKVFAISGEVKKRLDRWGHIPAEVLYPPPPQRPYRTEAYGDFVFAVSRLTGLKRLDLLVEAMARTRNKGLRAVIAGEGPERDALAGRIRERGLEGRVSLAGPIDEAGLLDHYARCRAVYFAPYHEDYGFVTGEAFASGKAVLTAEDSGGPVEQIRDGESGYIVPADPAAMAQKLDAWADDAGLAERMGQAGRRSIAALNWPDTIRRLLSA
ncbi:MAG: glycosyltransferase family 4 protein [Candidatus Aminicenantes bacterium]|nr:glycosyltransferase family 4 protein [Candidatus Aminicenantes bacterium]